MATELAPPLSYLSGASSVVTTVYDGPMNNYLKAEMDGQTQSELCNFLTVFKGKHCRLTQVGVGRRSLRPAKLLSSLVGYASSYLATEEDLPVWNDRRPQTPDFDPHETDQALAQFREWFDGFAYDPAQPPERKLVALGKSA